jgi:hypothetical protein
MSASRKYRTEIPNSIDDENLSVYAFRLYAHYKRVCGDNGRCFKGLREIAKHCGMSLGKVADARIELLRKQLITVKSGNSKIGEADEVQIVNIWDKNLQQYTVTTCSPDEQVGENEGENESLPVHCMNTPVHQVNTPVHTVNTEEEQVKKELKKNTDSEPNGSKSAKVGAAEAQAGDVETVVDAGQTPKRRKSTADPRSSHPSILLVKQLLGRYPNLAIYDRIIEKLGENPDKSRLSRMIGLYAVLGWQGVDWLAWYEFGIPERLRQRLGVDREGFEQQSPSISNGANGNGKHKHNPNNGQPAAHNPPAASSANNTSGGNVRAGSDEFDPHGHLKSQHRVGNFRRGGSNRS